MGIRSEREWDKMLQRRLAKYKTPRKSTYEEVDRHIKRFRKIGGPVFDLAADILEIELCDMHDVDEIEKHLKERDE